MAFKRLNSRDVWDSITWKKLRTKWTVKRQL